MAILLCGCSQKEKHFGVKIGDDMTKSIEIVQKEIGTKSDGVSNGTVLFSGFTYKGEKYGTLTLIADKSNKDILGNIIYMNRYESIDELNIALKALTDKYKLPTPSGNDYMFTTEKDIDTTEKIQVSGSRYGLLLAVNYSVIKNDKMYTKMCLFDQKCFTNVLPNVK